MASSQPTRRSAPTRVCSASLVTSGGPLVRLEPGGSVSIGRHAGNDLVLEHDPAVSRYHATVRWIRGQPAPVAYDNGSQNGTLVDGRELHGRALRLRHGSLIEVGHSRIELRLRSPEEVAIVEEADERVRLFSEAWEEQGTFVDGEALIRILLRLEAERRTGTLSLWGEDRGERSLVTLCLGQVMAVQRGEARRTRALEQLILLRRGGRYVFESDLEPTSQPMNLWFSAYLRGRASSGETLCLSPS